MVSPHDEVAHPGGSELGLGTDPTSLAEEGAVSALASIEAAFGDEPVDEDWATETEAQIALSIQNAELMSPTLESAECKSTLCRMEVTSVDDARDAFLDKIPEIEPFNTSGVIIPGESVLQTVVIFARHGNSLPQTPEEPADGDPEGF